MCYNRRVIKAAAHLAIHKVSLTTPSLSIKQWRSKLSDNYTFEDICQNITINQLVDLEDNEVTSVCGLILENSVTGKLSVTRDKTLITAYCIAYNSQLLTKSFEIFDKFLKAKVGANVVVHGSMSD